jgi:ABC-2 type transporter
MKFQYIGYELLRLWRNKPFFFFSLIFPIALFAVFALTMGETKIPIGTHDIPVIVYYMASMAGYGALMAALSGGARISTERSSEWDRQLHLTPLSSSQYMFAKLVTAYLMSALSMLLIYLTGVLLGARVEGLGRWVVMSGLILVGVLPFAILGVALGLILPTDAMGPALGGAGAFFGFLGGMWFPFTPGTIMDHIGQLFPSYWIAQASLSAMLDVQWPLMAWVVIIGWVVGVTALAVWGYGRSGERG